jgi:hypothetical protein
MRCSVRQTWRQRATGSVVKRVEEQEAAPPHLEQVRSMGDSSAAAASSAGSEAMWEAGPTVEMGTE